MKEKDKCASCPLAEILQLTIALNKRMAKQRYLDFVPVKDYKPLLDTKLQLN